MDKGPKLPTPMIDPKKVADAILDAATHHRRDVTVGAGAKVNTLIAKVAPSLGDKLAAKQLTRQQRDEAPRDPMGTLNKPGESGRIHGRGNENSA